MLLALWPSWLAPSSTLLRGGEPKGKGLSCGFRCGRVSQELACNFHLKAHLRCSHKESPFVLAPRQPSSAEVSPQCPASAAPFCGPVAGNVKLAWFEVSLQMRVIIFVWVSTVQCHVLLFLWAEASFLSLGFCTALVLNAFWPRSTWCEHRVG